MNNNTPSSDKYSYPYSMFRKNALLDRLDAIFAVGGALACKCVLSYNSEDAAGLEIRETFTLERTDGSTTITKKSLCPSDPSELPWSNAVQFSPTGDAVNATENNTSREGLLKSLIAFRLLGPDGLEFVEAYLSGTMTGLKRIKLAYFDESGKEVFCVAQKTRQAGEARRAA